MKKLLFILSILPLHLMSQQLGTIGQMGAVNYFFNPAAVDISDLDEHDYIFDSHMLYRQQWTSFEGAPRTAIVGLRYQNTEKHMSLNGFIAHDRFGLSSYTQIQVGYSYQLQLDDRGDTGLSLGMYFAGSQYRLDGSIMDVIHENDPLLDDAIQTKIFPAVGLGAYFYKVLDTYGNDVIFFAGLSGEQVIPTDVRFNGANSSGNLKREPHIHAFTGFRKYFSTSDYFEPVFWASKTFWSPLHLNGMVRSTFLDQKVSFGVGLSSEFQYYVEAGFQIFHGLKINYGISSFMRSTLSQQTGMSHEIILGYQFLSGGY